MQCAAVTISSSLFIAAVPLITVAVQLRLSTPSAAKVSLPTVGYPADAVVDGTARGAMPATAPLRPASGTQCAAEAGRVPSGGRPDVRSLLSAAWLKPLAACVRAGVQCRSAAASCALVNVSVCTFRHPAGLAGAAARPAAAAPAAGRAAAV